MHLLVMNTPHVGIFWCVWLVDGWTWGRSWTCSIPTLVPILFSPVSHPYNSRNKKKLMCLYKFGLCIGLIWDFLECLVLMFKKIVFLAVLIWCLYICSSPVGVDHYRDLFKKKFHLFVLLSLLWILGLAMNLREREREQILNEKFEC